MNSFTSEKYKGTSYKNISFLLPVTQVSQEGVLCRVSEQGWVHDYKDNTVTLKGKHRQRNDKQTQKKHGSANRKLIVHLYILLSATL